MTLEKRGVESGCVMNQSFGPHLMIDMADCDANKLDELDRCFRFLNELPEKVGMTKITQPNVFPYAGLVPEDRGITGVVVIAESHISIHTFPLKNYAFIDVFSCKPFDVEAAADFAIHLFGCKSPQIQVTQRGLDFPREMETSKTKTRFELMYSC